MNLTLSQMLVWIVWGASITACNSNLRLKTLGTQQARSDSEVEQTAKDVEQGTIEVEAATREVEPAAKLSAGEHCVDPDLAKIPTDVSFTLCSGAMAQGQLDLATLRPPNCTQDGASDCVAQAPTFKAVASVHLTAGNIKNGVTMGGVTGAYPSATHRLSGTDAIPDLNSSTFIDHIRSTATFQWFDSAGERHTHAGDNNLKAGFIVPGVSIFGVSGLSPVGVRHFEATSSGTSAYLTWETIGFPNGFLIVRRQGAPTSWTPTSGTHYFSGQWVDADHTITVVSGDSLTRTDTISAGGIYSYQIFAFNSAYAYSSFTLRAGVGTASCGDSGDSCYSNEAALAARRATTPLGKNLEYVPAGSDFHVWKEVGGTRILRANGLDEWAAKLHANGIGLSATPFTDYRSLVGRACPPNVFVDNSNPATTDNCLYYASVDRPVIYIGNHAGAASNWYVANQPVCTDRGMRTPALFETNAEPSSSLDFPIADGSRIMAGSSGVPGAGGIPAWTASPMLNAYGDSWWVWRSSTGTKMQGRYINTFPVRCVLP